MIDFSKHGRRFIGRAASLVVASALFAGCSSTASSPLVPDRSFSSASSRAIAALPAGIDATSCGAADATEVQRLIDQRKIATERARLAMPLNDVPSDPIRRHAWLLAHDPQLRANVVVRAATRAELANYRAAAIAEEQHLTAGEAVQRCHAVVPDATATACQVAPRAGFDSGMQSANCNDCPKPVYQRTSTADGSYTSTDWRTLCETDTPVTAYSSNGQPITTPNDTIVTITGYPGTNGPIPGAQTTGTIAGKTGSGVTPSPNYVSFSGWMLAPGLSFNRQPVEVYVWPSGQTTVKRGTITLNLDKEDWYNVLPVSTVSFLFDGDFDGQESGSPDIEIPSVIETDVARSASARTDASSSPQEALACAFAMSVFAFSSAAAVVTGGVTAPQWAQAVGTVGAAGGPFAIDVELAGD